MLIRRRGSCNTQYFLREQEVENVGISCSGGETQCQFIQTSEHTCSGRRRIDIRGHQTQYLDGRRVPSMSEDVVVLPLTCLLFVLSSPLYHYIYLLLSTTGIAANMRNQAPSSCIQPMLSTPFYLNEPMQYTILPTLFLPNYPGVSRCPVSGGPGPLGKTIPGAGEPS